MWRRDTTTGAAATLFVVKTAAAGTAVLGGDEREVALALGLQARAHAGGEEAERGDDAAVGVGETRDIWILVHADSGMSWMDRFVAPVVSRRAIGRRG